MRLLLAMLCAVAGLAQTLRPGTIVLTRPLVLSPNARLTGSKIGTTLVPARNFRGKALILAAPGAVIENLTLRGDRRRYTGRIGLPPYDHPFIDFYDRNGIVADKAHGLTIRNVALREFSHFPILIAASKGITIEDVHISDSGSLNQKGRNNTSGGILLEEGTSDFTVRRCDIRGVRGNGIWTHSLYTSARNGPGVIEDNTFEEIGRDALQVGHATEIQILRNRGTRIGWPVEIVDVEGGGTPVAIDTAGNVDKSAYAGNGFSEINGKCIDLDGFHHGAVRDNVCINKGRAEDYPHGHYGIVFNNTNPDMHSEHIVVINNTIDGTKFGGIFLVGSHHTIERNQLTRINLAGCNETHAQFGCLYDPKQPDLLRAGIYLGDKAERPDPARDNVVTNNRISGHGMDRFCIATAPAVKRNEQSRIEKNVCTTE